MEAYCKEVRKLKDKFHGLEINHIARRFNEAAYELTKITSTRGTVPSTLALGLSSKHQHPSQLMRSRPFYRPQK